MRDARRRDGRGARRRLPGLRRRAGARADRARGARRALERHRLAGARRARSGASSPTTTTRCPRASSTTAGCRGSWLARRAALRARARCSSTAGSQRARAERRRRPDRRRGRRTATRARPSTRSSPTRGARSGSACAASTRASATTASRGRRTSSSHDELIHSFADIVEQERQPAAERRPARRGRVIPERAAPRLELARRLARDERRGDLRHAPVATRRGHDARGPRRALHREGRHASTRSCSAPRPAPTSPSRTSPSPRAPASTSSAAVRSSGNAKAPPSTSTSAPPSPTPPPTPSPSQSFRKGSRHDGAARSSASAGSSEVGNEGGRRTARERAAPGTDACLGARPK